MPGIREKGVCLAAFTVMHGMLVGFGMTSLLGVAWVRPFTIAVYLFAAALLVVATLARRGIPPTSPTLVDTLVCAFWAMLLISTLAGDTSPWSVKSLSRFPALVILPYVVGRLTNAQDLDRFESLLRWGGIAVIPLLLIDRYGDSFASFDGRWTFFGQNHSPLLVSSLFAGSALSWSLSYDRARARRGWPLIALVTLAVASVWVSGRGATLCSIGAIGLAAILCPEPKARGTILTNLLVYVGALACSLTILHTEMLIYVLHIFTSPLHAPEIIDAGCRAFDEGIDSVAQRLVLYAEALRLFIENPVTGIGAAAFGRYSCGGPAAFPHSTLLQALAELGAPGASILIAIWIVAARNLMAKLGTAEAHVLRRLLFISAFLGFQVALDQVHGDNFTASGSALSLGIAASVRRNPSLASARA